MTDYESDMIVEGQRICENMIATGQPPIAMWPSMQLRAYRLSQRAIVARRGCCGHHQMMLTRSGLTVCAHTGEPCPECALSSTNKEQ